MSFIVASGPVIIEDRKLLVVKDNKDPFYKLPGGTVKEGEQLEEACIKRVKEEINGDVELISCLLPNILYENPATFGDHVIVETKIKDLEKNSITFIHKIYRESDKAILANVECVRSVMELETKKLLDVKKFFIDFV